MTIYLGKAVNSGVQEKSDFSLRKGSLTNVVTQLKTDKCTVSSLVVNRNAVQADSLPGHQTFMGEFILKYVILLLTLILKVFFWLLTSAQADSDDKRQIVWLDNPESDPFHDGDWEDYNGNTYSKNIDGNHYDQSGREWND